MIIGIITLVIGVSLGFITTMPNAMMCASGTPKAMFISSIGMIASLSMMAGGVIGCYYSNLLFILPGITLQFIAFAFMS